MIQELAELKTRIASTHKSPSLDDTQLNKIINNTIVVLMAGGESSRFKSVPGAESANKNAMVLPNGDTMIEMTIRLYKNAGFKRFAALVFHHAESVEQALGDGSKFGVEIRYSYDPEKQIGKGGAVLNAILNNTIKESEYMIIQNPDDVILDYEGSFLEDVVSAHIDGEQQGCNTTIAITEETPYQYTGMSVRDNFITDIQMYPMIPIPTHIGTTMFSPTIYPYFHKYYDINEKKADFEMLLFPILAAEKKLYSLSVPHDNWIAVNNLKAYNTLLKRLQLN